MAELLYNTHKKYWCAFSKLTKISSLFVNALYDHFGSIEKAWFASENELRKIEGLQNRSVINFIEERRTVNPEECLEYINSRGIDFINPEDERYPFLLRHISNKPTGLFVLGNFENCNLERTIAVVGSRKASDNARINLKNILSDFANTDICIVSGLAEGIDTIAHKTAVDNNIKTIAVIGGGFDKLYPKSNKPLFEKIINEDKGAVISEYWPDTDALSWHFPVRNRIVSGLSKGVLVAEAALKSGAMITANLALEQGRELMCIPGLISNPNTQGIYKLIKNGASIITSSDDILDTMNWKVENYIKPSEKDKTNNENLTDEENMILEYLKINDLTIDELTIKTNLNISDLMIILTKLELEGIISRTNSDRYTSVV